VAYALFLPGGLGPSPSLTPSGGLESLAPMQADGRAAAPEAVHWGGRRRARRSLAAGADHGSNYLLWPVSGSDGCWVMPLPFHSTRDEMLPFERRIETGLRRPPLSTR